MKARILLVVLVCLLVMASGWSREAASPSESEGGVSAGQAQGGDIESLISSLSELRLRRQWLEAIDVGEQLLERKLAAEKRLDVLRELARAYEAVSDPWAGPEARRCYQQILDEFPDAACFGQVALRLGELYDHIIRPGTEPDEGRAERIFQRAIAWHERSVKGGSPGVDLTVLRANMHLGNLYARQGRYDLSSTCYRRVYDCDPNTVMAPDRTSSWTRQEVQTLKDVVREHLVSNCVRPGAGLDEVLAELTRLQMSYPEDAELRTMIETRRQAVLNRWAASPPVVSPR